MTSRVIVSLRVSASPERAFAAFTDDVALWWRPNALFSFTPRSPGMVSFEGRLGGRFIETLPNGKVFEIGRITVEHRGWDTVPAGHVARHGFPDMLFLRRHGDWWRALLASLHEGLA